MVTRRCLSIAGLVTFPRTVACSKACVTFAGAPGRTRNLKAFAPATATFTVSASDCPAGQNCPKSIVPETSNNPLGTLVTSRRQSLHDTSGELQQRTALRMLPVANETGERQAVPAACYSHRGS